MRTSLPDKLLFIGQLTFFAKIVSILQSAVGDKQFAYEIKSGKTFSSDFAKGLNYWAGLSSAVTEQCNIVYSGEKSLQMANCNLLTLNDIG